MIMLGEELEILRRALETLRREAFLFAVCDTGKWREELMAHLEKELRAQGREVWREEVSPDQFDLDAKLEERRRRSE
ncbi:MAG: hypothetical protein NZ653_10060, partial [Anaerolineae bacterium]|nr:hypothetical protein [Anaerolineae bacterium]